MAETIQSLRRRVADLEATVSDLRSRTVDSSAERAAIRALITDRIRALWSGRAPDDPHPAIGVLYTVDQEILRRQQHAEVAAGTVTLGPYGYEDATPGRGEH